MNLQKWTYPGAAPEGSCGACEHIRRDEDEMRNRSVFYCTWPVPGVLSPSKTKAMSPPPDWCPLPGADSART